MATPGDPTYSPVRQPRAGRWQGNSRQTNAAKDSRERRLELSPVLWISVTSLVLVRALGVVLYVMGSADARIIAIASGLDGFGRIALPRGPSRQKTVDRAGALESGVVAGGRGHGVPRILYSTTNRASPTRDQSRRWCSLRRGYRRRRDGQIIAWAHGTVGLGDDCTPSALPRSPRDNEYLSHWLEQGYAVVGTDYVGLGTPGLMSYLNSVWTAAPVRDSVIAAHQMDLALSPQWAIVGQCRAGALP